MQRNVNLLPFNTFQVSSLAESFLQINNLSDVGILSDFDNPLYLGQGANVLFVSPVIKRPVVKNNLKGIKVLNENGEEVLIEAAAGEDWHEFVMSSVSNGWSGVENLAYIPGTVGAAAVGNIGAYGQTISNVVVEVKTLYKSYLNPECQFDYRESIFKNNSDFVTSVVFKLSKTAKFATDYESRYESLKNYLPNGTLTPKIIAEAIIKIRTDKLPDWKKIGTAGSFFKNPVISQEKFILLQKEIKELQSYPAKSDLVKVPAGRLFDELGWKGKRVGKVATYEKHALTVINLGGATGQEILDYTQQMQVSVKRAYDIDLEPEVKII